MAISEGEKLYFFTTGAPADGVTLTKVWPYIEVGDRLYFFTSGAPADGNGSRPSSRLQRLSHQVCIARILHLSTNLLHTFNNRKMSHWEESSKQYSSELLKISAKFLHPCKVPLHISFAKFSAQFF